MMPSGWGPRQTIAARKRWMSPERSAAIIHDRRNLKWPSRRVKQLRDLQAQGLSMTEIGRVLGVSRSAIAGKLQRLRGVKRIYYQTPQSLLEEDKAREQALVMHMRRELAQGMSEAAAFARAWTRGASYRAIGDVVGLSRERVRQIVHQPFRLFSFGRL